MPNPSVTHPDYDAHLHQWQTMRDAAAGEDAIKFQGEAYLPKLGGQETDEYTAYKQRASYHNATGRTIDGLSGMIFRKPPTLEHPDAMQPVMDDVTLGGLDFQGFSEVAVDETLKVGRLGILVDRPRVEVGGITQAQAERMNLRPFLSLYKAESIIDWRVGQVGNKTVLTHVRLREVVREPVDEFSEEEIDQIRVLRLFDDGGNTVYNQQIWRFLETEKGKKDWVLVEEITPQMNGNVMDFIPFIFVGPKDTTPNVEKPPLIDLALKNLDHYRMDADYKHHLHFMAAAPTRWVTGAKPEEIEEGVFDEAGPTAVLASSSAEAKFGIAEPNGNGLKDQRQALQDAESQMAALGAKMLAPEKRAAEAAETAAIHRQGEISVLSSLAQAVSIGLTKALEIARDWMGLADEVIVKLNTDYLPSAMPAEDMQAYTEMLQAGAISHTAFLEALIEGERLRADTDPEEEQQRIVNDEFAGVENDAGSVI